MKSMVFLVFVLSMLGCGTRTFTGSVPVKKIPIPEPIPNVNTPPVVETVEEPVGEVPTPSGVPIPPETVDEPVPTERHVDPIIGSKGDPKDPFADITKLGINFEDVPGTDEDYNDAVLCFEGEFKINNSHILSMKDQDIVATTSSISACRHKIEVKIFDKADQLSFTKTYDARSTEPVLIKLLKGDEIEVNMIPYEGHCGVGEVRSMRDVRFAKLLRNQCNTTGR